MPYTIRCHPGMSPVLADVSGQMKQSQKPRNDLGLCLTSQRLAKRDARMHHKRENMNAPTPAVTSNTPSKTGSVGNEKFRRGRTTSVAIHAPNKPNRIVPKKPSGTLSPVNRSAT